MAENTEFIRAQFMKKEKLIKDVMRHDARPSYAFLSAVRKELEKEKNVMASKLFFLYKVAQAFAPGSSDTPSDDAVGMQGHLHRLVEEQEQFVAGWIAQAEQKSKSQDRAGAPTAAQIPDIIKQYIATKDLLRQKMKTFVLTRRMGMVKTRLDETVRQMKAGGGVEKFAGKEPVEEFLKRQENGIVVELVMDEMAEKTKKLDSVVNGLVEWRAKSAAAASNPAANQSLLEQEMHGLVRDLVAEINRLKEQEKLMGETESGILNSADGVADLSKLKSNIHEQRIHANVVLDALTGAKKKAADGKPMLRPEEVQENKEAALNAADKIEALIRDERNIYINFRKLESPPGKFLEDISAAALPRLASDDKR